MPVTTCDIVREDIIILHDTHGLNFRSIAQMDDFRPIPAGTICSIYHTGRIPKKWYKRLNIPEMKPAPACSKCGEVHVSKRCTTTRKKPTRWADMPAKDVLRALVERRDL
jgi:hypothetical protein